MKALNEMKLIRASSMVKQYLLMPILLVGIIYLSGCGKEESLTPNQETEKKLTEQTWEMTAVTIDGVNSDLYAGLTISFNSTSYTSTNGGKIWPASGTWSFVGETGDKIRRDDGLEITIESINASQLVLTFTWATTTSGGRVASLKGLHRMTFKRKV